MKLNPTTKPIGKATINKVVVVTINNEERVFSDEDLAIRYYNYNIHRFPHMEVKSCE